jgi:type II secretory ATPase GspE/PulE/Tfp pilus assembly ATPase PilB-like protein
VPCARCSEPVAADPRSLELLGLDPAAIDPGGLRKGLGCANCAGTGYQGRIGLFEVMPVTRGIRELVVERAPESVLRDEALAAGMRTMRSDGLRKALAGRTTLEEVLRVTPADPSGSRRTRRHQAGPE